MHEMGLMDAVMRTVDRIAKEEKVEKVHKITLEVGELSGVLPHFLRECYEAVVDGTPYAETELKLEMVPGTLWCMDCEKEFPADIRNFVCPTCHRDHLTPMKGRDFTIKEIEAD